MGRLGDGCGHVLQRREPPPPSEGHGLHFKVRHRDRGDVQAAKSPDACLYPAGQGVRAGIRQGELAGHLEQHQGVGLHLCDGRDDGRARPSDFQLLPDLGRLGGPDPCPARDGRREEGRPLHTQQPRKRLQGHVGCPREDWPGPRHGRARLHAAGHRRGLGDEAGQGGLLQPAPARPRRLVQPAL